MKLYYFPSPNPQKVRFGMLELGTECEIVGRPNQAGTAGAWIPGAESIWPRAGSH